MRSDERKWPKLLKIGIVSLSAICGLILTESCTPYNPAFHPSYDVLNPRPEVRENPFGFVVWSEEAQSFIVLWKAGYTPDKSKEYILIDRLMSQWIDDVTEALRKIK